MDNPAAAAASCPTTVGPTCQDARGRGQDAAAAGAALLDEPLVELELLEEPESLDDEDVEADSLLPFDELLTTPDPAPERLSVR